MRFVLINFVLMIVNPRRSLPSISIIRDSLYPLFFKAAISWIYDEARSSFCLLLFLVSLKTNLCTFLSCIFLLLYIAAEIIFRIKWSESGDIRHLQIHHSLNIICMIIRHCFPPFAIRLLHISNSLSFLFHSLPYL